MLAWYRIELADGATPAVHSPRKIPAPQREKDVEELKRMEKRTVSEQVFSWTVHCRCSLKRAREIRCVVPLGLPTD